MIEMVNWTLSWLGDSENDILKEVKKDKITRPYFPKQFWNKMPYLNKPLELKKNIWKNLAQQKRLPSYINGFISTCKGFNSYKLIFTVSET